MRLQLAYLVHCLVCMAMAMTKKISKTDRVALTRSIHRELFNGDYVRTIVPVPPNDRHTVTLKFSLLSLDEVNEKDQKMVTSGRLFVKWMDGSLRWSIGHYGNVTSVFVAQEDIWVPDIIVANSVTKHNKLGFDELPCRVLANGQVDWRPALLLHTSCSIDVTYFPFDVQTCDIVFETLITTTGEVLIELEEGETIGLERYTEDGQWKLIATSAYNFQTDLNQNGVVISLTLERRTTFYILAIIMPVFLISLTGNLQFALPAPSGEKMGQGMTVLLAYAVHLAVVLEQLPNTSAQVSIFAEYLISLMTITCACVILSVPILRLYHRPETDIVGPKTKTAIKVLCRIMCVSPKSCHCFPEPNKVAPSSRERCLNDGHFPTDFEGKAIAMKKLKCPKANISEEKMTWQEVASVLDWFMYLLTTFLSILATATCASLLMFKPKDKDNDNMYSQSVVISEQPFWMSSNFSVVRPRN